MLNTCASGVLICSTVYVSILGDIPSTPGDVFSFILLILLATTRVPLYFKSYAMSGPEKIRSRGLLSHIVSKVTDA